MLAEERLALRPMRRNVDFMIASLCNVVNSTSYNRVREAICTIGFIATY